MVGIAGRMGNNAAVFSVSDGHNARLPLSMIQPNAIEDIVKDYAGLIIPNSFTVPIDQSRIISDILKSEHLSRYPPSKSFQLQFLKSVISHLEHINGVGFFKTRTSS